MLLNTIRLAAFAATALAVTSLIATAPAAAAGDTVAAPATSRISATDPLNGGFLIANMHGMLFHPDTGDISEDLAYARWLGAGVVRVFATDSSGTHLWNGSQVGARIAEIAPMLRAAHLRLIVAFVNNHQAVPGELSTSAGWMDNYMQLLLPFYTNNWRGTYRQFVHDLISTVQMNNARDVIFAWELGNELHTPRQPDALIPFIQQDAADVRALDPTTPILPGTMGANHVEPGNPNSSIARWLYCDAPVDAYTLHAYDWVSRQRPGDMPIDWDLDNILSQPCPSGRALPVIVEELGTSRALSGMYTADDERSRIAQEQRQIEFVRHFPQVVGFGVWNAESPRLLDRTFVDTRRGLTSYGLGSQGGGSCYDPTPDPAPGARCQYEQMLRGSRFVRVGASNKWMPGPFASASDAVLGGVDPVYAGDADPTTLTLTGWVGEQAASAGTGVDGLDLYVGTTDLSSSSVPLAGARMGLKRDDIASSMANPNLVDSGFSIDVPLDSMPPGPNLLTLAAHTSDGGMWFSSVAVVVPGLGSVPARAVFARAANPVPVTAPLPPFQAEVAAPQPGDPISKTAIVQVLAPSADRVDVFMEPDQDHGGKIVGSATRTPTSSGMMNVTVSLPLDAHTLYVHVSSSATGQQSLITIPVVVVR